MKRVTSLVLCLMLTMVLAGCAKKAPIAKVQLQTDGAAVYQVVYEGGKCQKAEPFQSAAEAHYAADFGDFQAQVVDGKVVNTLRAKWLTDEAGQSFLAEEPLAQLLETAADAIDHDISAFDIWVVEGRYFAFAKLNVNWSDPCVLYEYVPQDQSLTELARWDKADLTGLALP